MMNMDRRAFLGALALLTSPGLAKARARLEAESLINRFLDRYVGPGKLPGAVLAIQRAGAAPSFVSRGLIAPDSAIAATPDSLFRIYSMTKPVTCLAVLKLVEDGKLRLDQPLSDILPDFARMSVVTDLATMQTRPAETPILIRHLLTHTAGFSYSINSDPLGKLYGVKGLRAGGRSLVPAPGDEFAPATDLEEFCQRLAQLPLIAEPGTRWVYSVAMDVLGLVIQRVSRQPFYDYLKTAVLDPIGMTDTDFMVGPDKADRLTSVVSRRGDTLVVSDDARTSPVLRDRDLPSGGGGLISTARDYARFIDLILRDGRADGAQVITPETARLFRNNLLDPGVTFPGAGGYGAGVSVALAGRPGMEAAGTAAWFGIAGTQMWIDHASGLGAALMIQSMPAPPGLSDALRAAVYGDLAHAASS
jgi:CubicO group peptidase (beta-lactamase class C family)